MLVLIVRLRAGVSLSGRSCVLQLAERRRHDARVSSRQCVIRISETHKTRAPVFGRSVKFYIWSFYVKLTVKKNVKWLSHFTVKSRTLWVIGVFER